MGVRAWHQVRRRCEEVWGMRVSGFKLHPRQWPVLTPPPLILPIPLRTLG